MKILISHIVGSGDFTPRLMIDAPNGDQLVHFLELQSARDAAFILNDEYGVDYSDAVRDIKIALLETTRTLPDDLLAWAKEK